MSYAFLLKPVDISEVIEIVEKVKQERAGICRTREDWECLTAEYACTGGIGVGIHCVICLGNVKLY